MLESGVSGFWGVASFSPSGPIYVGSKSANEVHSNRPMVHAPLSPGSELKPLKSGVTGDTAHHSVVRLWIVYRLIKVRRTRRNSLTLRGPSIADMDWLLEPQETGQHGSHCKRMHVVLPSDQVSGWSALALHFPAPADSPPSRINTSPTEQLR